MVKKVVIFGSGIDGQTAMVFYVNAGVGVTNFLDDDVEKQGTVVDGIEVISLKEYIQKGAKYRIIICGDDDKYEAVKKQLDDAGIVKYERCIDFAKLLSRERFVSFSYAKSNCIFRSNGVAIPLTSV